MIGAAANSCETAGLPAYVCLWDEAEKKLCNADIDMLEIRKGERRDR